MVVVCRSLLVINIGIKMHIVALASILCAVVVTGVPVGPGELTGAVAAPKTTGTTTTGTRVQGSSGVKRAPKKIIRTSGDELKGKRIEKENRYLNAEGRANGEFEVSTESLMNDIYTKGRERRKMKGVLSAYLVAHLALTAIRSYTVVSPHFNVLFTSIHALLEKLLPNIEDRWVERQTELQGLVWDYLDRHSITDPPAKVRIYHGKNSVTIPVLKKSRDAPLPPEFRDIGETSYAMYRNIVF